MKLKSTMKAWSASATQLPGKRALSCLATVRTLSRQIAESQDLAALLDRILRAALRETASECGLIGILSEAKDYIEIVSQVGWRLGGSQSRMVSLSASPFLAKAVRRRTSFSGSLVDRQDDPGKRSGRGKNQLFLGAPLLLQEGRRGILVVARESRSYAAHEKTALETLAAVAVLCLEKDRWQLAMATTTQVLNEPTSQRKLQQKRRLADMGFIAGSIVHELRQPLSTIQMIASYLKATGLPAKGVSNKLEMLEQQAELAGKILSSLVSFARSGKPQRSPADVHQILEEVLKRNPSRPEIRIERKLEPLLPPALADPVHVDRIISNLIDNGVESMAGPGTLFISTRAKRETVLLEITDTGCGVCPEVRDRIFEPFVTTKQTGTGLGLTLCRELAEANGGSIVFQSRQGQGSSFELRLPRA